MTTWFTSDTHYGHANIIRLVNRPFPHVDAMDEAMVDRWNALVQPDDLVYHLGDFSFHKPGRATSIAARLNGQKFLVWGNHDKPLRKESEFLAQWIWCKDLADIEVQGKKIILCHYAMKVWNKSHHDSWQLYGHSHGSLPDDPNALQLDVGVDCWDYRPVSFEQVAERMAKKNYRPVDHHGDRSRRP